MNITKIGDYIKRKRNEKNFTQQYIADKLSISPQAVSKWERGESLPDITLLPIIADILDINIEEILNGNDMLDIRSTKDIILTINSFIDDKLFQDISNEFINANSISDIKIPLDIFMFLNDVQKEILIDILLDLDDFEKVIYDIINFLDNSQKKLIIEKYLNSNEYERIEEILPFISPELKDYIVLVMLDKNLFDEIENILPFLSRKQKQELVIYITKNNIDEDIIGQFLPFFNIEQQSMLEDIFFKEENENE